MYISFFKSFIDVTGAMNYLLDWNLNDFYHGSLGLLSGLVCNKTISDEYCFHRRLVFNSVLILDKLASSVFSNPKEYSAGEEAKGFLKKLKFFDGMAKMAWLNTYINTRLLTCVCDGLCKWSWMG